jgi:hypothetical protein
MGERLGQLEQNMKKKHTTAAMHVRVRPSAKAAAVRMAQEDNRSMVEWLEWLIKAEAARLEGKKVRGGRRVGKGAPSRRAHH